MLNGHDKQMLFIAAKPSLPSFEVLPRHGYNCLDFEACFEFEILVGAIS
jgi:hypothetical protein